MRGGPLNRCPGKRCPTHHSLVIQHHVLNKQTDAECSLSSRTEVGWRGACSGSLSLQSEAPGWAAGAGEAPYSPTCRSSDNRLIFTAHRGAANRRGLTQQIHPLCLLLLLFPFQALLLISFITFTLYTDIILLPQFSSSTFTSLDPLSLDCFPISLFVSSPPAS